jgi:uncharacterized membrane protein YjjP (DUF1212 family)
MSSIERILWDLAAGKMTTEQAQEKLRKIYAKAAAIKRKQKA